MAINLNFHFIYLPSGALLVALLIAWGGKAFGQRLLGVLLGLVPIGALIAFYQWSLYLAEEHCLEVGCRKGEQACAIAHFDCMEWSGYTHLMNLWVGILVIAVYLLVWSAGIWLFNRRASRR